ncbi:MAG: polyribonucleotide nucleotidyltransferase [Oscillospiraceae bacterium]|jgi:polyribonucleotide nucleotidyltransferase|nr:polyribonucleotide nucleotidyltransferase [Oscillospiraceae bacterium]
MFKKSKQFEMLFAGRELKIEVGGDVFRFSNGACIVSYGDTVIMANAVVSSKPREGIDFFPLSVDFEEKLYAVGKIPGSFFKREGRPAESAILASRLIDRSIRPLFSKDMKNDVAVTITVLAVDQDCSPEVAGIIGASIALAISDIPWKGPIAAAVLGYVDNKVVINPTQAQREESKMLTTLAGSPEKVVMIESGADEIEEKIMLNAIKEGHGEIKKVITFINEIVAQFGKEKLEFASSQAKLTDEIGRVISVVRAAARPKLEVALDEEDKVIRDRNTQKVEDEIKGKFAEEYAAYPQIVNDCLYTLEKEIVRHWLVNGRRVDGRGLDEMRELSAKVGLLPRVHGSGMFVRGRTQVLTVATLGMAREAQLLDGLDEEERKRYIHHYNFPSYSVGETKPPRGPGRREVGHGALAERALLPIIPSLEEFPYTIRLVSEVLSSNGSTSQGAVCGSTLALMDAGVPIKAPVAGISCGLVCHDGGYTMPLDIQGIEDFFGDMDFKVAGTKKGITAIQVDIKTDGLTYDIIEEAFEKTRKARIKILDEIMLREIAAPRPELNEYVSKIRVIKIDTNKIREVIGAGGKIIQKLIADFDVTIDIEEDGTVFVASLNDENNKRAIKQIEMIVQEPEIGAIYTGKITKLMPFGAFVEILPGKEGLVHISRFANKRVEKIEDVAKLGEEIKVKLISIDEQGKLVLSKKDAT